MCGIIGIVSTKNIVPSIVEGLKRLEYRGYDSAGVATLQDNAIIRCRAEGKLVNLEERLKQAPMAGTIGIGHTRWATHGEPTENNAHPHATKRVAVVHNGIIENYAELKAELQGHQVRFETDTDTEVIAHLVAEEMKGRNSAVEAVAAALPKLRGAFALAWRAGYQPALVDSFGRMLEARDHPVVLQRLEQVVRDSQLDDLAHFVLVGHLRGDEDLEPLA